MYFLASGVLGEYFLKVEMAPDVFLKPLNQNIVKDEKLKYYFTVQRHFCWQTLNVRMKKFLADLPHDTRMEIEMIIKNAGNPMEATNFKK